MTEPILQNIGIMKPVPGYLEGLRELADEYGFVLIFDEVKTGFRYSVGGYSQVSGVQPDLVYFAKAVANGYPFSALGGKRELLEHFAHPDPSKRPIVSGTYNGPPRLGERRHRHHRTAAGRRRTCVPAHRPAGTTVAGRNRVDPEIQGRHRDRGSPGVRLLPLPDGSRTGGLARPGRKTTIFAKDLDMRRALIERGIYFFPVATKQCSISAAHTEADIDRTLEALDEVLSQL